MFVEQKHRKNLRANRMCVNESSVRRWLTNRIILNSHFYLSFFENASNKMFKKWQKRVSRTRRILTSNILSNAMLAGKKHFMYVNLMVSKLVIQIQGWNVYDYLISVSFTFLRRELSATSIFNSNYQLLLGATVNHDFFYSFLHQSMLLDA